MCPVKGEKLLPALGRNVVTGHFSVCKRLMIIGSNRTAGMTKKCHVRLGMYSLVP